VLLWLRAPACAVTVVAGLRGICRGGFGRFARPAFSFPGDTLALPVARLVIGEHFACPVPVGATFFLYGHKLSSTPVHVGWQGRNPSWHLMLIKWKNRATRVHPQHGLDSLPRSALQECVTIQEADLVWKLWPRLTRFRQTKQAPIHLRWLQLGGGQVGDRKSNLSGGSLIWWPPSYFGWLAPVLAKKWSSPGEPHLRQPATMPNAARQRPASAFLCCAWLVSACLRSWWLPGGWHLARWHRTPASWWNVVRQNIWRS